MNTTTSQPYRTQAPAAITMIESLDGATHTITKVFVAGKTDSMISDTWLHDCVMFDYDSATDTLTNLAACGQQGLQSKPNVPLLIPRATLAATGKIYNVTLRVIDSVMYFLSESHLNRYTATSTAVLPKQLQVLRYDLANNQFDRIAQLNGTNIPLVRGAAQLYGLPRAMDLVKDSVSGKLVLIGNFISLQNDTATQTLKCNGVALYDTSTGTWSALGSGLNHYDSIVSSAMFYSSELSAVVAVGQFNGTGDQALQLQHNCKILPSNLTTITGTFSESGVAQTQITLGRKGEVKNLMWDGSAWVVL